MSKSNAWLSIVSKIPVFVSKVGEGHDVSGLLTSGCYEAIFSSQQSNPYATRPFGSSDSVSMIGQSGTSPHSHSDAIPISAVSSFRRLVILSCTDARCLMVTLWSSPRVAPS